MEALTTCSKSPSPAEVSQGSEVAAAVVGDLVAAPIVLVGFTAVAIFYGVTSHGLDDLPRVSRRGSSGDD